MRGWRGRLGVLRELGAKPAAAIAGRGLRELGAKAPRGARPHPSGPEATSLGLTEPARQIPAAPHSSQSDRLRRS
jgi:hypothetical protein